MAIYGQSRPPIPGCVISLMNSQVMSAVVSSAAGGAAALIPPLVGCHEMGPVLGQICRHGACPFCFRRGSRFWIGDLYDSGTGATAAPLPDLYPSGGATNNLPIAPSFHVESPREPYGRTPRGAANPLATPARGAHASLDIRLFIMDHINTVDDMYVL